MTALGAGFGPLTEMEGAEDWALWIWVGVACGVSVAYGLAMRDYSAVGVPALVAAGMFFSWFPPAYSYSWQDNAYGMTLFYLMAGGTLLVLLMVATSAGVAIARGLARESSEAA